MVNALVRGFSPSLGKNPSKFLIVVWARPPFFCRYKPAKGKGEALVGKPACEALLQDSIENAAPPPLQT
eukprot:248835-Lingulodinium_polyedra.AAC.1